MLIISSRKICKSLFIKNFIIFSSFQLIVINVLSPDLWRRTISAFPAMMVFFTNLSENKLESLFYTINRYSYNLIWPRNIGLFMIIIITLLSIYQIQIPLYLIKLQWKEDYLEQLNLGHIQIERN